MNVIFNHGPYDGTEKFLPLGYADTIIIEFWSVDYLYRRTDRLTREGRIIFQYIGIVDACLAS